MRADSAVEPTKVREHHRDLAALGGVLGRLARRKRGRCGGRVSSGTGKLSNRAQHLPPMPE